jgi:hypothetical protein
LPRIFLLILLYGYNATINAQPICSSDVIPLFNIDSLNNIYKKNKQLLKEYRLASLIALSYFPELTDDHIKFKFSSINSTARTTVTFLSLFRKINKQFIIYINDDIQKTGILLCQAPFDAQVAVIAHELAHVVDFKNRNFSGMAHWGGNYLFEKDIAKIERDADKMVIERGLGWQLYNWAYFVLNHSDSDKHYLKIRKERYLLPNEIKEYISKGHDSNP